MERIICIVIGYLFGLIQTSYIIGRTQGIDIRSRGSGNAGTTNALRTLGAKCGAITLLGDVGKCILAVLLTWLIFHKGHPDTVQLLKIWTAAGVVLGHDFPFYMGFKGGKGFASMVGMAIAFCDWHVLLVCAIVFFGLFFTLHYVSLSSLSTSVTFLIGVIISGQMGKYSMPQAALIEMYLVTGALVLLTFIKHRSNIARLLKGEERKTFLKKH